MSELQFIDSNSCNLCNQGLINAMQDRIKIAGNETEAAKQIAEEINAFAGSELYTTAAILNRYRYYAKDRGGDPKKGKKPPPPEPTALERAGRAVKELKLIPKDDPQWKAALYEVGNWINAQFK